MKNRKSLPHILHIHTHLPLPLALAGRLVGAKIVVSIHGTDLLAFQRSNSLKLFCRYFADEIWYVSTAMCEPLKHLFPGITKSYLPSGVDLSLFRNIGFSNLRYGSPSLKNHTCLPIKFSYLVSISTSFAIIIEALSPHPKYPSPIFFSLLYSSIFV